MSKKFALRGLVAATFTPMHADGSLNLAMAGPMIERLLAGKVSAAFACGTTGECASLTSEDTLTSGMTITIEPGIYVEGQCGVRIEDCCVVTDDGCLNLTGLTKELITI